MKYLSDKRKLLTEQDTTIKPLQTAQAAEKQQTAAPPNTQSAPQAAKETAPAQAQQTQPAQTPAAQSQPQAAPAQAAAPSAADQAQALLSQQPGAYKSKWGSSIDDVLAQLLNPQEFTYDPNTDPLYLMLRDQAAQNGKLAMEDTMGQAAQLTGGYGNSHAQMLGQQVYSGYLSDVNAMVPELKEAARAEYDAANDALLQKLGLMMDQENQDYGRYMDEIEQQRYADELAYSREQDALANERYESETAYNRQQDAYDRLLEMIASTGYQPTAEELAAAGMTESQAKAWRGYYSSAASGNGSGGTGSSGSSGYRSGGSLSGEGNSDTGSDETTSGGSGVKTPQELGDPFKKESYTTVTADCAVLAGNGASASEIAAYIKSALNDGIITKQQYESLMAKFGGLVDTGSKGSTGSGGSSGGRRGLGSDNRYIAFG